MDTIVSSPAISGAEGDADDPDPTPEPRSAPADGNGSRCSADAPHSARPRIAVEVLAQLEPVSFDKGRFLGLLEKAARFLARPVQSVSIIIVDDPEMSRLHERYRNDPATTDVLTFDLSDDPAGAIEADIFVCADEAARNAESRGHEVERELLLYALHGLLHCSGHDDHDAKAFDEIHAEEDRILRAIGVGATFEAANVKSRCVSTTRGGSGHADRRRIENRDTESKR